LTAARVLFVEVSAVVVLGEVFDAQAGSMRYFHILADGDVFHLGRDDSLAGIPKLGDGMAFAGAERFAALAVESGKFHETVALGFAGVFGVLAGEIAVVLRLHLASV